MTNNEKFITAIHSKDFNYCPVCSDQDFNILSSESGRYIYCPNCDTCFSIIFLEDE